jgi:hypothetical protein
MQQAEFTSMPPMILRVCPGEECRLVYNMVEYAALDEIKVNG